MLLLHDPRCADYETPGHPERPARVLESAAHLRRAQPAWEWRTPPETLPDELLLLAHTPAHLRRLEQPRDFDPDTAWHPGIGAQARRAAASAHEASRHALAGGGPVFSLMRPPGHHACAEAAMGFCYLNSAAIAALAVRREHGLKVAVWDFDAHHGNGTEDILLGREGFLYSSVHQSPCYPGTGASDRRNCRNWPVPPHASRASHLAALRASWEAVLAFQPGLVLVSAGFDAYARDPLTQLSLEAEDFAALGGWLAEGGAPAAAVLEGGYSPDLPRLIEAFLAGWQGSGGSRSSSLSR
ncbi:MAG TPA: histone deacetylase [Opitutaceae bacterium]|jgi:acetoin utilization deacetylase AcuC-like enzyme|nr:histone deacetylase [Opitutaceae bacterium]